MHVINSPVRVLIIDDSAMIRKVLAMGLSTNPLIEVVGTASGADQAFQMIEELSPDVLTLDIEMPKMDGVTFLRRLMPVRPIPTVVISSATQQGAAITLQALEAGAVDIIAKPTLGTGNGLPVIMAEICRRVQAAAHARPFAGQPVAARLKAQRLSRPTAPSIIAIGASTGGVQALAQILQQMPYDAPGIVIVQHMPEGFTAAFANRVDASTAIRVREARDGDPIMPGVALIAPGGDRHLVIMGKAPYWHVALIDGEPECFSRPSVNVMFESAALRCGPNCVAALLTGMGKDGAQGLLSLHRAGAVTIAQDEATSVVWGMPAAAVDLGAAKHVLPLGAIAPALIDASKSLVSGGRNRCSA
ncbi:chemotaxis response regulator protein-glutamate methylesterase [Rhodobacter sp. ETT8]|uniref:Protein-glutamate methylesterase/protein-glutamine glutaminase n=2 Tax=Pseudotabrizicola algicola TaxID=2709381 RepID=A0A6B3RM05_9RHOB|nr:chemotaxis response regulator protein-glutamate methylesterase [Pseudotabrizicola algicola]